MLLQRVAACCSVLQSVVVFLHAVQYVTVFSSRLWFVVAVCCSVLQCIIVFCSALQYTAVCDIVLQCTAVRD